MVREEQPTSATRLRTTPHSPPAGGEQSEPLHSKRRAVLEPQPGAIVPAGVQYFKLDRIGEFVPASVKLNYPRESVCRYPDSGRVNAEGLEHRAWYHPRVPPDTNARSEKRRGLTSGRYCERTAFSEGDQCPESSSAPRPSDSP